MTECASEFPGTVSISPEFDSRLIPDICLSLIRGGLKRICVFNSHFEPAHVRCIYEAIDRVKDLSGVTLAFTDITRKKYSSRLVDVFRMGQSHADRYETSLIMAIDPSLIDEERRRALPYLAINLVDKIFNEGLSRFKEFGMPDAYCGDPASATAGEGEMILGRLSDFIIEDALRLVSEKAYEVERGLYGRQRPKEGQWN